MTTYYVAAIAVTAAAAWASSVVMAELTQPTEPPTFSPDPGGELNFEWETEPLFEVDQAGEPIYPGDTLFDDYEDGPELSGGLP